MDTSVFSIFLTEKITNHVFYEYKGEVLGSHMQKNVCVLYCYSLTGFIKTHLPQQSQVSNILQMSCFKQCTAHFYPQVCSPSGTWLLNEPHFKTQVPVFLLPPALH